MGHITGWLCHPARVTRRCPVGQNFPLTLTFDMPPTMTHDDRYKWIALSNTTLGMLMATIDTSIMLIALPDIFRGIHLTPLLPGNSFYLLWMILSFLVVTSVLVVSLGRLGDMYGRVRMYNLGFAVYTFFSLVLAVTWMSGTGGRPVAGRHAGLPGGRRSVPHRQLVGDPHRRLPAGPAGDGPGHQPGGGHQRHLHRPGAGRAARAHPVAADLPRLGPDRLFGTVWAYRKLREVPRAASTAGLDWPGNLTFALGLVAIMVGITYGIQPYGGHTMGWTSPSVLGSLAGGVALLAAFCIIETRVAEPMFRLALFRIRAFTAGSLSTLAGRHRSGRPDVHAHHLAAGDLAARCTATTSSARRCGPGSTCCPLTAGLPDRRADLGHPVRPLRLPTLCHRRA